MIRFKKKLKSLLYNIGAYKLNTLMNTCYIIAYHRVVKSPCELFPDLSINAFENQIRHLSNNYTIVPVIDIVDRINKKKPLKKLIGLTFDDGFKDNFTNAYPILKKYNAPATVYLISECIETGNAPWFMHFRQAFLTASINNCKLTLGGNHFSLALETTADKKKESDRIMSFLQNCKNHERLGYVKHIFDLLDYRPDDNLSDMMLNWDEINEMSNHGISFGAHTHTHPVLSSMDISEAELEIVESKNIIEKNLGKPVDEFAYPVGKSIHYSKQIFPILKKHHFKYAVSTSTEKITYKSNHYGLSRPYPWELKGELSDI